MFQGAHRSHTDARERQHTALEDFRRLKRVLRNSLARHARLFEASILSRRQLRELTAKVREQRRDLSRSIRLPKGFSSRVMQDSSHCPVCGSAGLQPHDIAGTLVAASAGSSPEHSLTHSFQCDNGHVFYKTVRNLHAA